MKPATPCSYAIEYPGGVVAIDSGLARDRMAACYLLEAGNQAAFIETGTPASAPRMLEVLERRGLRRAAVRYVIVTHVHLDHAGGAGPLMQDLPNAELLVHPRGARHMVDPAKLEAGVRAVYGDEAYDASYGALTPIETSRVREMGDGDTVSLGGRELLFRDTPGHARHHFCVWDEVTRAWFTGDTFGISYRELDTGKGPFIMPTTTPVQLDPPALAESVSLLLEADPEWMYLTHFGRVGSAGRLADELLICVDALVDLAKRHKDSETRTADIESGMLTWLKNAIRAHGVTMDESALDELLALDVKLNTQGLECWLDNG